MYIESLWSLSRMTSSNSGTIICASRPTVTYDRPFRLTHFCLDRAVGHRRLLDSSLTISENLQSLHLASGAFSMVSLDTILEKYTNPTPGAHGSLLGAAFIVKDKHGRPMNFGPRNLGLLTRRSFQV